jgi:hypothetical protein
MGPSGGQSAYHGHQQAGDPGCVQEGGVAMALVEVQRAVGIAGVGGAGCGAKPWVSDQAELALQRLRHREVRD